MNRRALLVASVAAVVTASFTPAATAAGSAAPLRAGYLAKINPSHTVTATVIAPNLTCPASGRRAVAVGIFGTLTRTYHHKTSTHEWAAVVRTVCDAGTKSSRAIFVNHVGASASMPVRPGHHIGLEVDGPDSWSLSDITAGRGEGGGGGGAAGSQLALNKQVLFGVQVSTPALPKSAVHVLDAANGKQSLGGLHPVARAARQNGQVVARPTALHPKTGAFDVTHA